MVNENATVGKTPDGTVYRIFGEGEPIILIHGVGLNQSVWEHQVTHFSKTHQVVTYDTLGHGGTKNPSNKANLAEYSNQLLALMDALNIDKASIIGHSMGALVALDFALTNPTRSFRVGALSGVFMRGEAESEAVLNRVKQLQLSGINGFIDSAISRWFGNPVPEALRTSESIVRSAFSVLDPLGYLRAYQVFAVSDRTNALRLANLNVPALFLTGELDANSSPAMSQSMAQRVLDAEVVIISGAGHMINMTHPVQVNDSIGRLLLRQVADGATVNFE